MIFFRTNQSIRYFHREFQNALLILKNIFTVDISKYEIFNDENEIYFIFLFFNGLSIVKGKRLSKMFEILGHTA